jgi:4-amino-4-deoxy-L-arabinose transferase-like glycosyltransferase
VYQLICALILLNLAFWLGNKVSMWTGLIAGVLILCDYNLIFFGNHLFPELPLTLCLFLFLMSYYLLLRNEMVARIAAFIGALALFGAFLLKTTIILILPLILFLFINDRRQKRHKAFWIVFIFLSLFFFILNGLWYEEVKGDFFFRFENIANNHVVTPKTFFDKGGIEILKRLTYLPLLGFLKGGFFIPLVLALPSLLSLKRSNFKLETA